MSTLSRKPRYHHGDLRNGLLAAAGDVMGARGVDAVTLREVARIAGVSHNAPYRHFASREALLAALATQGFLHLRDRLQTAGGDLPALGQAYLGFAVEDRARFLLMFGGALPRAAFPDLAQAGRAALAVLDRAVSGDGQGDDGPVGPETLRAWALAHGLAHLVADGQIAQEDAVAAFSGAAPCP